MLARVARFDHLPDDLDDEAVEFLRETLNSTPGYVAGFHMVDPTTRRALSVTVFEDDAALQRAGKALASRPDDRTVGIAPSAVEVYPETHAF